MKPEELLGGSDGESAGVRGVWAAVVTDNVDPEKLGRVKVTYPWRDADDESYWARVAVPMAGPERGTYFLPEVDDEVLVAFENGDIHYPYVLGALWNGVDRPPADNADGANDVRLLRSRSGHEVVLNDAADGGGVTIETSAGHRVVLDDAENTVTIADRTGTNTLTFDATANAVDLAAGGSLSVSAPTIELKGDGNVTVEAGAVLTLKGSLVTIN